MSGIREFARCFFCGKITNLAVVWRGVHSGMSSYDSSYDKSVISIFERADSQMYKRKRELKRLLGAIATNDNSK